MEVQGTSLLWSHANLIREMAEKMWAEACQWAGGRISKKKYHMPKSQKPDSTVVTARRRRHHLSRMTRVWNVLDGAAQGRFSFWIARREKVLGFGVLDARRGKVLVARRGKVLVARRGKVLDARQGPGCAAREGSGCAVRKGSRCAARKGSAGSGCAV